MIPKYLFAMWPAIAPALGNHLWQSTVFAVMAGLLTLFLRKNQARTRYWLWLAASGKFLIPFSLLVSLGSHLSWLRGSTGSKARLYLAIEEVSQPFTHPISSMIPRVTASAVSPRPLHLLPALLTAAWLCGFVVVLFVWGLRWRRVSAAMRGAAPLQEGREVEALRRLERVGGVRKRIEMLVSRTSLEPGIFGIVRPVLLWPEGISKRLEDAHLAAVLAHEVWRVRRRDNLSSAIHMAVEALFWFHPLVWWLGARLIEERERACDEEVVELGSEREIYAESILKVCEFCVESPLACVSGVTGADLKKRMVHIMNASIARKLDFGRKLLLSTAGLLAVVVPIFLGLVNATPIRAQTQAESAGARAYDLEAHGFETASIKPHKSSGAMEMSRLLFTPYGFSATNVTLQTLIRDVYRVQASQIVGPPDLLNSDKYDIDARMEKSVSDELRKLDPMQSLPERQRMLQALLADRFKLTVHHETKELPVYALIIAENGAKLQEAKPGDTYANGIKGPNGHPGGPGNVRMGRGTLTGQALSMADFVRALSDQLGRPVLDKTGLTGKYDLTLQWTPDDSQLPGLREAEGTHSAPPPAPSGSSLFTVIQEQLGLELESQDGPVETLVIDHVEKPSEN
jgi:bla regulator protein blaR1